MIKFDDYREKYSYIRMERQGGILRASTRTAYGARVHHHRQGSGATLPGDGARGVHPAAHRDRVLADRRSEPRPEWQAEFLKGHGCRQEATFANCTLLAIQFLEEFDQ